MFKVYASYVCDISPTKPSRACASDDGPLLVSLTKLTLEAGPRALRPRRRYKAGLRLGPPEIGTGAGDAINEGVDARKEANFVWMSVAMEACDGQYGDL